MWKIAKDGLKALLFWFVASLLMVHFLGDTGRMLSYGLGLILLVSFFVVRLIELVGWLRFRSPGSGAGGKNTAG